MNFELCTLAFSFHSWMIYNVHWLCARAPQSKGVCEGGLGIVPKSPLIVPWRPSERPWPAYSTPKTMYPCDAKGPGLTASAAKLATVLILTTGQDASGPCQVPTEAVPLSMGCVPLLQLLSAGTWHRKALLNRP